MKRWIATGLMIAAAFQLWAQAPEMFRYQGRLVDGTNLVNATLPMSFKLYDALSGGNLVYEDSSSVLVVDGLYSTYIGDNTVSGALTNAMTNAAVYLELTVNGATLSPRERLVSVPYALNQGSSLNGITQETLDARYALLNGSNIGTNGSALLTAVGAMGVGDAIATVTNSVEQAVSTNTASVPSSAAVKTGLDAISGSGAVAMVIHPNKSISYHTTLKSAAKATTSGCSVKILRPFYTTNCAAFYGDNVVLDGGRIPFVIENNYGSGYDGVSDHKTAIQWFVTNGIIKDLVYQHRTPTNYLASMNAYALVFTGGRSNVMYNSYIEGFYTHYVFPPSTNGTPKVLVNMTRENPVRIIGGAIGVYAANPANGGACNLMANHNIINNFTFVDVKFYNNNTASIEFLTDSAQMPSNQLINCSFNKTVMRGAFNQSFWRHNISGLSKDEVNAICFPTSFGLFTDADCTATQGIYAVSSGLSAKVNTTDLTAAVTLAINNTITQVVSRTINVGSVPATTVTQTGYADSDVAYWTGTSTFIHPTVSTAEYSLATSLKDSIWSNCTFFIVADMPLINPETGNAQWRDFGCITVSNGYQSNTSYHPVRGVRGSENADIYDGINDTIKTDHGITGAFSIVQWVWLDGDSAPAFRCTLASENFLEKGINIAAPMAPAVGNSWMLRIYDSYSTYAATNQININSFSTLLSSNTWTCLAFSVGLTSNETYAISHLGNVYKPTVWNMPNGVQINGPLYIGKRNSSGTFDGGIYSTAIFTPALSTNDLVAAMNGIRPKSAGRVLLQ